MSSDSRKSKSKSRHSRSGSYDRHEESTSDYGKTHSDSLSVHDSSSKQERRRSSHKSSNDSDKRHGRSHSPEKEKKSSSSSSSHIKSLVTVNLPSLLTSPSTTGTGSNITLKPKVVQNKSGSEKKGLVAKSLMDLQFKDRTTVKMSGYRDDKPKDKKAGLLPEPYEMFHQDHIGNRKRNRASDSDNYERYPWPTGQGAQKVKRSWTESDAISSHSMFNSIYKPLVIESEPLEKMRKTSKSPKSLLDSQVMPTSALMLGPLSLLKTAQQGESYNNHGDVRNVDDKHHPDKIVQISCAKKRAAFLIIPSTLPWVHLHGRARIRVIKGVVTILAHTLKEGDSYEVYSPSSNCLLSLQVDAADSMSPEEVRIELLKLNGLATEVEGLSKKSIGIIKVERLDSVVCDYITTLAPFTKLFVPTLPYELKNAPQVGVTLFNDGIKVAPESEMNVPCMNWNDGFNTALDKWLETIDTCGSGEESPVFVSCGAKNSGKSLFNRCAINTTLRSVSEVAYLDCDVGQTEFSPPATVSLHIISKPVLSSPFCHQRKAEKMVFYGDVSPAQDPALYVNCLQYVFKAYKELAEGKKLPLIVNTMGFPIGVGYMLFVDTLNIVRPDLVIQFESDQLYGNFPPITREAMALDEGWTYNKCPPADIKEKVSQSKAHTLLRLPSVKLEKTHQPSYKLQPADLRNLSMYAVLSAGLSENESLASLTPYTVAYSSLAVHVCWHKVTPEETLLALDGTVVALCEADLTQAKRQGADLPLIFEEMPICDCLGLGIIRGVDTEKGLFYISTSLPRCLLTRTNTIVKGTLAIPDQFILKQKGTSDYPIPYVDAMAQATASFGLQARSRMARIHTPRNN